MSLTYENLRQHIAEKNKLKYENEELKRQNERLQNLLKRNGLLNSLQERVELIQTLTNTFNKFQANQIAVESVLLNEVDFDVYDKLKQKVCDTCNIKFSSLFNTNRKAERVLARNILRYYLRYHFKKKFSLKDIGNLTGKSDHSTVLHSISDIENEVSGNAPKTPRNILINSCLLEMINIEREVRMYKENEFNNFSL